MYLGLCFHKKLTWTEHINNLSLQLAKCGALLYQICEILSEQTLKMLDHAFICSRVQYRISVWETATKTKLFEIEIRLHNIVLTITWNKRFSHTTHLYKKLDFLKLNDIYKFELANSCINFMTINCCWYFKVVLSKLFRFTHMKLEVPKSVTAFHHE